MLIEVIYPALSRCVLFLNMVYVFLTHSVNVKKCHMLFEKEQVFAVDNKKSHSHKVVDSNQGFFPRGTGGSPHPAKILSIPAPSDTCPVFGPKLVPPRQCSFTKI